MATALQRPARAQEIRSSPREVEQERPLWEIVAVLYTAIALLAVLLIGGCFLAAYLVTGTAY